ncbi:hypothetical protein [Haloarcula montana]|uniref:hypothetical protein n=1 Tax=Haloarcula montana TaxID=3111776 RepID=UPI002D764DE4|nr:hypothetical protein [Haloarcula sp. GH36]
MDRGRTCVTLAVVTLCLGLGGCQAVYGPSEPTRAHPVTPAPVPTTETPAPTPPPNGRALGGVWLGQWSEFEPESAAAYRDVQRTCERPPAQVVRLQLGAILTDNGTRRGIETMWRFLAPSARQSFGSVETYVETFQIRYRPLLGADSVTYRPIERNGSAVVQPLRTHNNGSTTTYRWRVERLSTASGEECWLTTEIRTGPAWTDSVGDEHRRLGRDGSDTVKSLAVNP